MLRLLADIFARCNKGLPPEVAGHTDLRKRLDLKRDVKEVEFVAFDTELTGLDFRKDSLISIGALRLKGGSIKPGETFYRLVKPESELKHKSVVVHEITPTELEEAVPAAEAVKDFLKFAGDAVLVGHFVHIDLNFVSRCMKKHFGVGLQSRAVDTSSLHDWLYDNDSNFARHYKGMTTRSDLFSLANKYGIPVAKGHNAFNDAYLTAQLFQKFLFFLKRNGINTLKELLVVGKT